MNIVRYLGLHGRTIRGKTIVHVGAHFGEEALRYQAWGAKRVIWIEAVPHTFEMLKINLAEVESAARSLFERLTFAPRTRHQALNALIGEEEGKNAEFHLFDNDGNSSSLFRHGSEGKRRFPNVNETGEVLHLPMRRLDHVLEDAGVDPAAIDILVVDVQGAELICLKGAGRVLEAVNYIECEVSTAEIYQGGVLLPELESWLQGKGFRRRTRVHKSHMNAIFSR